MQKFCWSSDSILKEVFCEKGKSVVQKSVLEFGTHSLGSVLCNGVVLRRRIAKEVVSRKLHVNPKNILKTR